MATAGRGGGQSPANVTKNLKGVDFPASKQELLKHAKQLKAEDVVINEIQNMEDKEYNSMADVMKSFGKESHGRSSSQESHGRSSSQGSTQGRSQEGQQGQRSQSKSHGKSSHH